MVYQQPGGGYALLLGGAFDGRFQPLAERNFWPKVGGEGVCKIVLKPFAADKLFDRFASRLAAGFSVGPTKVLICKPY
jgi:hypothetical protein